MIHDVTVVGAGVAGLQCARRLAGAGARTVVVDRADKPGGRCATRPFHGLHADYGPLFLHGSDPGFLDSIHQGGGQWMEGWPREIDGSGTPCQPRAFAPFQRRGAFREGANSFAQALSSGLQITLRTLVTSISPGEDSILVESADGEELRSRDLVLALALEQSLPFIRMLPACRERDAALALLEQFTSLPCLTVIAGYPPDAPAPRWDVCYPEDSEVVLLIGNESARGGGGKGLCLVCQARPRWSREMFDQPKEHWSYELLRRAARRLGPWVQNPQEIHAHRWRYGRLDFSNELASALSIRIGGRHIWLAGDLFSPGGGIQAAWSSGDSVGARLSTAAGK